MVRQITGSEKHAIFAHYTDVNDWKNAGPFCVDGRYGVLSSSFNSVLSTKHLFTQALGGSLLFVVLTYIIDHRSGSLEDVLDEVIADIHEQGFSCGVHRGSHAHGDRSDCGFADNLPMIIERLVQKKDEIASLITSVAPGLISKENQAIWDELMRRCSVLDENTLKFESGEALIARSVTKHEAQIQTLKGDHAEIAAIVNLKDGTTLDTSGLVQDGAQAFNLDLWYVLRVTSAIGLDPEKVKLLSLGLYIATEMVLVEEKHGYRLPVLLHQV